MKKLRLILLLTSIVWGTQVQAQVQAQIQAQTQPTEQQKLCEYSILFGWNKWEITPSARAELSKLLDELKNYPEATISIVGWTDNTGSAKANASMSLRRAQSVKAYLQQNGIATERITADGKGVDEQAKERMKARRADITATVYIAMAKAEPKTEPKTEPKPEAKVESAPITPQSQPEPQVAVAIPDTRSCISLRTNLLYWAGGMPNIGMEWMASRSVGIVVNGGWAPWSSNNWKHNWSGWFVSPEIRWYLGEQKRWFAGVQFLAGEYNFKPRDKGLQGTVMVGGITGGYKLPLSKCFDMDFNLGLGYGKLKYDTYRQADNGVNVFTGKGIKKSGIMPLQAGVSLIWKIK